VEGSFKHGNETSGSIKGGFFDQLSAYQLLMNDSVNKIYYILCNLACYVDRQNGPQPQVLYIDSDD
jgi:hypothetical protein